MSISEYARHRGCDLKSVQYAVARERITRNEDGTIDSELADREWEENTDHSQVHLGPRPPRRTSHRNPAGGGQATARALNVDLENDPRPGVNFHNARAAREVYEARLKKLSFEQKQGNLLVKADVEREMINTYTVFREALLNVPNRISAQLAAETDPLKVHELLEAEIRLALSTFAGAPE